MAHFNTFLSLFESAILPLRQQHPTWTRLDGRPSGGNPAAFATFDYGGYTWRIHKDTRLDRLTAAYALFQSGREPFKMVKNNKGQRCLRLASDESDNAEGLYIYESVAANSVSSKKHPESVYHHGCPSDSELLGVMDQCIGVRILVHDAQPIADPHQDYANIQGPLTILDAGTAPYYSDIFKRVVGKRFADAKEALDEMNRIKAELDAKQFTGRKHPRIVHAFKSGKFRKV